MKDSTKPRRPPNARDVAGLAEVSVSTVSLVLNGKAALRGIPEATIQRVMEAVERVGYRPNAMAAGLRRQTSDTIGFISDLIATTPHAGPMIQGAQDAAWEAEKILIIVNTGDDRSVQDRAIEMMLQRQVEGFVYATMYHRFVELPAVLREIPSVLLDCRSEDTTFTSVTPDEQSGAVAATEHLLSAGHRRIGYLQTNARIPAAMERLEGFKMALQSRGVDFDPHLVATGIDEFSGGFEAASSLLDLPTPPSALVCFNDRMAAGAFRAAHRRGMVIPRDLSVAGFDNEELVSLFTDPALTTVQLPHYEMGYWAVTNLLGQIAGTGAAGIRHRIACPLVARDSVGPPKDDPSSRDEN
ncbi:MAG: LacI family DNA-binding transcriptional regulator [Spirochaetaceae bacterium]|nr:MAG: LacI family DNA-binding transcriptional regulator [Spirochaetaceae bacterium]